MSAVHPQFFGSYALSLSFYRQFMLPSSMAVLSATRAWLYNVFTIVLQFYSSFSLHPLILQFFCRTMSLDLTELAALTSMLFVKKPVCKPFVKTVTSFCRRTLKRATRITLKRTKLNTNSISKKFLFCAYFNDLRHNITTIYLTMQ